MYHGAPALDSLCGAHSGMPADFPDIALTLRFRDVLRGVQRVDDQRPFFAAVMKRPFFLLSHSTIVGLTLGHGAGLPGGSFAEGTRDAEIGLFELVHGTILSEFCRNGQLFGVRKKTVKSLAVGYH